MVGVLAIVVQSAQRTFGQLLVVGDHQPAMRWLHPPQDHVTASLPVELVAQRPQSPDRLPAGDPGQTTQTATSTNSSVMEGGMGSSCALRLSR